MFGVSGRDGRPKAVDNVLRFAEVDVVQRVTDLVLHILSQKHGHKCKQVSHNRKKLSADNQHHINTSQLAGTQMTHCVAQQHQPSRQSFKNRLLTSQLPVQQV